MQDKNEIIKNAMRHIGKPIDEITRRNTYRARSPGVKPTTGIKLILPKTSSMAEKIQKVLDGDDPKKLKQMNNLVIGREDDGKEISLEFKTSASREKFRKMMNESVELDEMKKSDGPFTVVALKGKKVVGQLRNVEHYDIELAIDMMRKDKQGAKISVESKSGKVVHTEEVELDESVKIMFKGFGKEVTEFQQKLKKFGQAADYRIMMQNFKNHSNVGDGLYFTDTSKGLGFEIHSVRDRMMGDKIRKLGDSQDLGGGKTVTLIAIKEDVQLDETNMSLAQAKKKSAEIQRKFAVLMRKHRGTKVGEVLDLLAKDGERKVHEDSDIKLIKRYLTKFKDNVRKVAHQMMIDFMEGDDYLAKKRIPVREDVQLDENVQNQVKRMDRRAKQKLADKLNDLDLSGYGDYEARVDNVHKFKPSDLKMAMEMMSLKEAESLKWTGMKDTEREELVRLAKVPARVTEMKWREIPNPLKERLAKYINKSTKGEFALVEERAKVPTYVIDRKTKKIVHGPTDTADAKLYLDKQITPRKFMIRQIRGAAKKVGDKV